MTTICGRCEKEWPTNSGLQICAVCGNDGEIEGHVVRDDRATEDDVKEAFRRLVESVCDPR